MFKLAIGANLACAGLLSFDLSSLFAVTLTSALAAFCRIALTAIAPGRARQSKAMQALEPITAPCGDAGAHWSRVSGLVAAAVETAHAAGRAQAAAMEKIDAADYALAQLMDDLEAVLRPAAPALAMIPRSQASAMTNEPSRIAA